MGDGREFDQLSRKLAQPMSRRGVFKALGVAAGGAVAATVFKPFHASAVSCPSGFTPCGGTCCNPGVACADAANSRCGCPAGTQVCGFSCCKGTCSNAGASCCCAAGTTPCGAACCNKGIACVDASNSVCGCPAGYTPCGPPNALTCCQAGQACTSGCPPVGVFSNDTACCKSYQAPCGSGNECCSGLCSSAKGNRCGCASNADCPKSAPICDTGPGFCHT
jgi:hypothetical protein